MKKAIFMFTALLLLVSCFDNENTSLEHQSVAVQFLKSASIDVATAGCRVTAEDMDTINVDLTVTTTQINGEISNVPFGSDRLFEISCFNSQGVMNYYGSAIVDINSIAPVVDIVLYPVVDSMATVTITGTFADTEETEEKIVFVADWGGDPNIYMMDVDGSNIRQMTTIVGYEHFPCLSPDRSKILFQRATESDGPQPYIVDVETLEETFISSLSEYDPKCMVWNPSGTGILFHTNYNTVTADIYYYDLSTETVTPLVVNSATNWVPTISPDGENLIYYSNISGTYKAYIANTDGSDPVMILPDSIGEQRIPRMHPTDPNLFMIAGRGYTPTSISQWGLFLINRADGSISNIISTDGVDESWPVWSPDGSKILYERNSGGNHGIYIINPDGTDNKALIDTPSGYEEEPFWR